MTIPYTVQSFAGLTAHYSKPSEGSMKNRSKNIVLLLTFQAILLGAGLMNAFYHPSIITVGGALFMLALLQLTIRNAFRVIAP